MRICACMYSEDYIPSSYGVPSDSKKLVTFEMEKYQSISHGGVWMLGLQLNFSFQHSTVHSIIHSPNIC